MVSVAPDGAPTSSDANGGLLLLQLVSLADFSVNGSSLVK